ncbi:MAG: helix-turn-helix domain-containing protein [Edaphobacter sp.]
MQNFRLQQTPELRDDEERTPRPEGIRGGDGEIVSIAEMEKQAILGTIRQLKGDKLMAAKLLGIGKTTLYRKLKEYGITEGLGD